MNETTDTSADIIEISAGMLRDWPLPMPDGDADKEVRGHLLIVAGSREMPGAVLLAATAALRAGAGKLTIATAASGAVALGVALPEARVIGLQETPDGGLRIDGDDLVRAGGLLDDRAGLLDDDGGLLEDRGGLLHEGGGLLRESGGGGAALREACQCASAVLIGPGMQGDAASVALVGALLPHCAHAPLILDAAGMRIAASDGHRFDSKVLLTPHAGELAGLTGADKQDIASQPEAAAREAAQRWHAWVALKGATTVIAAPEGALWRHRGGNTGLAISGSGDALAGLIAGLAARGAALEQAASWGVALHAMAGEQLSLRHGPLGYLAREISAEVPALLRALSTH
ncbi:NAD(P)H-hydrate dehydratase [Rugamonas sp. FT107W]|uniref:ADP-dependent (S)-NAD(P)H-hydrate dehydratase n=1 Tax=Duganella vulcania TaxID=2692166 RepID=A0A845HI26_9BURK|nr:ADP/ATP-dependent (S)-NAD(P)H-hydrate dehydratase [Duganella vulcania]MYN18972.1 NAD(P)H-hydrate dehydratase [Duganella vulcania]